LALAPRVLVLVARPLRSPMFEKALRGWFQCSGILFNRGRAGIIIGSAPHVLWASVFLIALASTPAVVAVLPPLVPTE